MRQNTYPSSNEFQMPSPDSPERSNSNLGMPPAPGPSKVGSTVEHALDNVGPWVTDSVRADNTPTLVHPSPSSDVDARMAIAMEREIPGGMTPNSEGEYSIGAILAVLAVNVAKMNDNLTRNREEPFSFDVIQANEWVRRVPRGVIKCIVNPTANAITVALSESSGPGANIIAQVFAANSSTYGYWPFVRGVFCQSISGGTGLKLNGIYTES